MLNITSEAFSFYFVILAIILKVAKETPPKTCLILLLSFLITVSADW